MVGMVVRVALAMPCLVMDRGQISVEDLIEGGPVSCENGMRLLVANDQVVFEMWLRGCPEAALFATGGAKR